RAARRGVQRDRENHQPHPGPSDPASRHSPHEPPARNPLPYFVAYPYWRGPRFAYYAHRPYWGRPLGRAGSSLVGAIVASVLGRSPELALPLGAGCPV